MSTRPPALQTCTKRRQSTVALAPDERERLQRVMVKYGTVYQTVKALHCNEVTLWTARTGGLITPKAKARLLVAIERELLCSAEAT